MCTAGSIPLAKHILQLGADVNRAGSIGKSARTPLWTSVWQANVPMSELLLHHGANADFQDDRGNTSLLIALQLQNMELVDLLLNEGHADVNLNNFAGETPLLRAVASRRSDVVARILAAPAILVNKLVGDGYSVLYRAVEQGDVEIIKQLLQANAGWFKCLVEITHSALLISFVFSQISHFVALTIRHG